jgi:hypothetical protein
MNLDARSLLRHSRRNDVSFAGGGPQRHDNDSANRRWLTKERTYKIEMLAAYLLLMMIYCCIGLMQ